MGSRYARDHGAAGGMLAYGAQPSAMSGGPADDDHVAPYTYANFFGMRRKGAVLGHVDALAVHVSPDAPSASRVRTVNLELPVDVLRSNQRVYGVPLPLVDAVTKQPLVVRAGSVIRELAVHAAAPELGPDVAFVLGAMNDDLATEEAQQAAAQRWASVDAPVTGPLLNRHRVLLIDGQLDPERLSGVLDTYEHGDAAGDGYEAPDAAAAAACSYDCLTHPGMSVGEPRDVYPVLTPLSGDLPRGHLSISMTIVPPATPSDHGA